jgi:hypothetical protein
MRALDPATMRRMADARWALIAREHTELGPAIALQQTLILKTIDCWFGLDPRDMPRLDAAAVTSRLSTGIPALRGEYVRLPIGRLAPLLREFTVALEAGAAAEPAARVRMTIDARGIEAASWLGASFERDEGAMRRGAIETGLAPDLLWLVGELAVGPWAARLEAQLDDPETADDGVSALINEWTRGYCYACGSWPALAEAALQPWLRCSFCGAAWSHPEGACVYCARRGTVVRTTPDAARTNESIEACDACGGYLKSTACESLTPYPLLAIQDLATSSLDVWAASRGYGRPRLPELPGTIAASRGCAAAQEITSPQ